MTVGSQVPVVGTPLVVADALGVAEAKRGDTDGVGLGDAEATGVGLNDADGVASPSTEVPLLRMVKERASDTACPVNEYEVAVTTCFPGDKFRVGVHNQVLFSAMVSDVDIGEGFSEIVKTTCLFATPKPLNAGLYDGMKAFCKGVLIRKSLFTEPEICEKDSA